MSEIKSKQDNFFFIFRNANFKKYQIKNDVNSLSNLYKDNGFRNIKVTYKTEYISSKNTFNVYFYINEGLHYNFSQFHADTQIANINFDEYSSLVDMFKKTCDRFNSNNAFTNFGVSLTFKEIYQKSINLASSSLLRAPSLIE